MSGTRKPPKQAGLSENSDSDENEYESEKSSDDEQDDSGEK